ncbi:MAG: hypothetical protein ACKVX9_09800 [Blastocatellia bacterium]
MARKTILLPLFVLMIAVVANAQKSQQAANVKLKMKTARLHIDGFMKSRSGAV